MSKITFNTTTEVINQFKGQVAIGTLIETLGYSTVGDGGGAQWVKTATTGTPNQSHSSAQT
jgi:hypothetical protein